MPIKEKKLLKTPEVSPAKTLEKAKKTPIVMKKSTSLPLKKVSLSSDKKQL